MASLSPLASGGAGAGVAFSPIIRLDPAALEAATAEARECLARDSLLTAEMTDRDVRIARIAQNGIQRATSNVGEQVLLLMLQRHESSISAAELAAAGTADNISGDLRQELESESAHRIAMSEKIKAVFLKKLVSSEETFSTIKAAIGDALGDHLDLAFAIDCLPPSFAEASMGYMMKLQAIMQPLIQSAVEELIASSD